MILPQAQKHKIQALWPPSDVRYINSDISHCHIVPSFGRSEKMAEVQQPEDVEMDFYKFDTKSFISSDYHTYWAKDIPCKIRESPLSENWKQCDGLRIILESNLSGEFQLSHRVMIATPLDDLFFHWTFKCTPFSFKTLVNKMEWEVVSLQTTGDPHEQEFKRFGYIVKTCADKCARFPNAAKARVTIDEENKVTQLVFTEIVNNYREIEILVLEFVPSEWELIKKDVLNDYNRIKKEYEEMKTQLVHVLDTVAINQPGILLSKCLDEIPVPSYHPPKIKKMIDMLTLNSGQNYKENAKLRDDFINEFKNEPISHLLTSKSIPVSIIDPLKETEEIKTLTFMFYALGKKGDPDAYSITVSDPNDIFFHFTSLRITPDVFKQLTRSINMAPILGTQNVPHLSRSLGGFRPIFKQQPKHEVPFHHENGIGGVVGVFANDLMEGVINQPERFKIIFF